jgi:hypothetical protein
MRTRLLAAVAVLAAALLTPSAALADVEAPAVAAPPSPTATSPVTVNWTDVAVADGYRVFRANANCTTGLTNISNLTTGDVAPGVETFPDSSPLTGTHCYFVRAFVGIDESPDSNHVLVTYDQDLPTGSITSPIDGAFLSTQPGPLVLTSADANDATSGVLGVQFFSSPAGANAWTPILPAAGSGPPYNVSWAPADGTYDLYATITDNVNHSIDTATVLGVVVDGTLPTTPAAPTGATPVKVAPTIAFSATTDPLVTGVASGIDHYDVYRDGSRVNVSAIPAGGPYAWSDVAGQSTSPASGSHSYSYTVVAFDRAGNQSAQSPALVILMDTVAPTTPAAPTGASPVNVAPTITVTATTDPGGVLASGVDHYDVYRDGSKVNVSAIPAGGPYVWSDVAGQSTSPASGSHSYAYTVVAVDGAGNQSAPSAARTILMDTVAPATPAAPTGATPVNGGPTIVVTTTTDPGGAVASGVDHYDVYRDGSKVNVSAIPGGGPYAWSDVAGQSTSPASGSHSYSYTVFAIDAAGNQSASSAARVILMDSAAPTTPAAPTGATPVNVAPTITVTTTTDPGGVLASGVDHYDVYRDGSKENVSAIPAGGPYVWSDVAGQSTSPASGSHSYSYAVVAVDLAGNQSAQSAARVILMDSAAPTTPAAPTGATPVNVGPTIVVTTTTDPGGAVASGVDHYDVYRDGSKVNVSAIPELGPHGWSDVAGQSTSPASGSHSYSYTVVAIDAAGNQSAQSVARVILMDSAAPTTPGAPTGLSPVSAAPTITVTTTTDPGGVLASGVDHYDVYRDGSKVNVSAIPALGPLAWSDVAGQSSTPASGSHAYLYTVVAVDVAGNQSVQSLPHTIVLDPGALSAPTSVTALATPTSQFPQVSWGAPPGALFAVDHYNVYRDGGGTPVGVVAAPATTFTDSTPNMLDGSYTYQVVAAASNGTTGVASGAVTVVVDTHSPSAPGGVNAGAALDGSIGITWAASSDGTGSGVARYIVRRSLSSTPPASVADGDATCQVSVTSCTDSTTLNGKLYTYAVFAVDLAGNISLGGTSAAVTARDQLGPVQPSGLAVTPGDASVALRWAAAGADDDVAGYVLVAKPGSQAPTSDTDGTRVCAAITATSTACTATGLTNGATYTFGLFALDEALNRSQPATVTAAPNGKVSDAKAPAAVSKLKAKVAGHKVTLTWANPADKDFDHVEITAGERKPAALKASKRVYSGKGTKAGVTLAAGQQRWFVVVAYDAVGNASAPASVHVTIAAASKFGPAPSAKVRGKVKLSWPVAKGAKYYNVQLYAGKKRILVSWPNGRALQVPRAKLKRGTKYTWYVWPGLGAKAKAHYGKLIGKNTFTFAG